MKTRRSKQAFTLIELLVVVAIIALLISILLPALQGAREQAKKGVCLTNMRSIAQACNSYANEDRREMVIPIHRAMVSSLSSIGFTGEWNWRTGEPFSYGGRTPTKPMPTGGGTFVTVMTDDNGLWAARTRPLNRYVYGDIDQADAKKLGLYRCPSDTGYPDSQWVQDAPRHAADIPCYDMLGNSYRINTAGLAWGCCGGPVTASLSVSAYGHAASSIENPARVVLFSEPMFYNFSRQGELIGDPSWIPIAGWHRKLLSDNVAYCDGSARMTRVDQHARFDPPTLEAMNHTPDFDQYYFLRRGRTWQTDCYPAPGALMVKYTPAGSPMFTSAITYRGWPFAGYTRNTPPGE